MPMLSPPPPLYLVSWEERPEERRHQEEVEQCCHWRAQPGHGGGQREGDVGEDQQDLKWVDVRENKCKGTGTFLSFLR